MTTERVESVGAQPTDPALMRLLFLLVEGREGQVWRAVLLLTPLLLVLGLVLVTFSAVVGSIVGAVGVGSLIASTIALSRLRSKAAAVSSTAPLRDPRRQGSTSSVS